MKFIKTNIIIITLLVIVLFSITLIGSTQHSLNYKWDKGKIYTYAVESDDNIVIESSGPMNYRQNIDTKTRSQFSIEVIEVYRNGSADAFLYIDKFEVTGKTFNDDYSTFASIEDLPKKSLKSKIHIDRKGRFKFYNMFYILYSEDNETFLVSVKIDENSTSASVNIQGTKVEVYAGFDPETGEIKSGYSIENLEKTKKVKNINENYQKFNILPVSFLEMMELPEGTFKKGDRITSKIAYYEIILDVLSVKDGIAKIKNTVRTLESEGSGMNDMGDINVNVDTNNDNDFDMNFNSDFNNDFDDDFDEDMEGFPNPSEMLNMNGDFTYKFDMKKGMLNSIEGEMETSSKTESMMVNFTIDTKSQIKMKLIKQ
jgi:hypothetical protein